MSKDTTQTTDDNITNKTIVIPQAKLPSVQKPSANGESLPGEFILPAKLLQAFSDFFFSRRTIPDDLISVINDSPDTASAEVSMPQEPETSENLPDVQYGFASHM